MNMGLKCENGGTYDASLEDSRVCNCQGTGFTGAYCTDAPGTMNTKCTREKAIISKLSEKMRDLIAMVTKGDDDNREKESDREGMGQGTGQGMGQGMGMGNTEGNRKDGDSDDKDKTEAGGDGNKKEMGEQEWIEHMLQEEHPGVGLAKLLQVSSGIVDIQ